MEKVELRNEWAARVAAFKASGKSTAEWCTENNLKPHQLRYWLRKDRLIDNPSEITPRWLSLEIGDLNTGCQKDRLIVRIGQAVIEIQPGFNPTLLSDVVRVLAHNVE